ncbi:VOC family protein [Pseudoalteromonas pernae]|uniref:VOC family protein n=1 Tax=Pseudoalteromonas pernae TaxID=3118054 RepID=UPI003242BDF0
MAKITGLGGVFYVVSDVEATKKWYREKLGIDGDYGPQLSWTEEQGDNPYSLISYFKDNQYLKPSEHNFMINLRVDDLAGFIELITSRGVEVLDSVDEGYGKFAWILDPNGVKIELWEQVESP